MSNGVRPEDRLEGATNFTSWKIRIMSTLKELEIDSLIEKPPQSQMNEDEKCEWNKNNKKAMRILIDSIKDHIIPTISFLESTYHMFSTLVGMFEINNTSIILALKNDLSRIWMNQGESITSYLMRITKLRNQLANIGHAYYEKELSMIILNGLPLSLDSFI